MTLDIETARELSVEEFRRRYACRNLPVVLLDCIEDWPARKSWTLEYFSKHHAKKELKFSGKTWVLDDFIKTLRAGTLPAPYLKEVKLDEQFPELNADIGSVKYARPNLLMSSWLPNSMRIHKGVKALFIGAAGSGFGKLHWDYSYLHVFISQIRGEKDFVLYPPSETAKLYPDPDSPNKSRIPDFNDYDPKEFPLVASASPIRLTLKEGQTLFVPAGWWHATAMRGFSISVAESTLDIGNWRQRSDWYLDAYRKSKVPLLKRALLRTYLRAVEAFVR
ncbi:hypothetical protein BH11PSE11_BH11PSE11_20130 [soil metagenome]